MKSSNIFMNYLTNLIEYEIQLTDYFVVKYLSNLSQEELEITYKTEEERKEVSAIHQKLDSCTFRQKCLYELFKEILGETPYWLLNYSEEEEKNIIIYPDIIDKENNKYYFNICGEQVECREVVTANDYRKLHAATMKKLLETKKVTPEMIEQAIKKIEEKYPQRFPSRKTK